jgi:uncharacterized glyoxalase superfamily protein PhnB
MKTPNLIILYVEDPLRSSRFYEKLLGRAPLDGFPSYQCFELDGGMLLGLWSTAAKDFVSSGSGHRSELAFQVENEETVARLYEEWKTMGVTIEQALKTAVFGSTFVGLDPDGHRLRVNTPDS